MSAPSLTPASDANARQSEQLRRMLQEKFQHDPARLTREMLKVQAGEIVSGEVARIIDNGGGLRDAVFFVAEALCSIVLSCGLMYNGEDDEPVSIGHCAIPLLLHGLRHGGEKTTAEGERVNISMQGSA